MVTGMLVMFGVFGGGLAGSKSEMEILETWNDAPRLGLGWLSRDKWMGVLARDGATSSA